MNQTTERILPAEELRRIANLLERIDHHIHPPLWKRVIRFLLLHFFTIASLLFLAYVTWQIWGVVDGIQGTIGNMMERMGGLKFW